MNTQTAPLPDPEAQRIAAEYEAHVPSGLLVTIYPSAPAIAGLHDAANVDTARQIKKSLKANRRRHEEAVERHKRILGMVADGMTDAQIARRLRVTRESANSARRRAQRWAETNGGTSC